MSTTPPTSDGLAVGAVLAFYAAVGSGDIPAAPARLGETVSWHAAPGMPYAGPEPYRGAQQVAEHVLGPITADIDGLTLTNHEVLGLGTTVAALGTYKGGIRRGAGGGVKDDIS